jgi:hypothetical protein
MERLNREMVVVKHDLGATRCDVQSILNSRIWRTLVAISSPITRLRHSRQQ